MEEGIKLQTAYWIAVIVGLSTSIVANTLINSIFKVLESEHIVISYMGLVVFCVVVLLGIMGYGFHFVYKNKDK